MIKNIFSFVVAAVAVAFISALPSQTSAQTTYRTKAGYADGPVYVGRPATPDSPASIDRTPAKFGIAPNGRLEVCWTHYNQCITFSHLNARHTGGVGTCSGEHDGLQALTTNAFSANGQNRGYIEAGFQDCQRGLGYWQGQLCISTTEPISGRWDQCGFVVEVDRRYNDTNYDGD